VVALSRSLEPDFLANSAAVLPILRTTVGVGSKKTLWLRSVNGLHPTTAMNSNEGSLQGADQEISVIMLRTVVLNSPHPHPYERL
jgi:hypothetical protein